MIFKLNIRIDASAIINVSISPVILFSLICFFFYQRSQRLERFEIVKISCSDLVRRETDSLISLYFSKSSFLSGRREGGQRKAEERLSSKLFPIIAYKNAKATSIWRHHRLPNASFSPSTSFFPVSFSLSLSLSSTRSIWTHLISIKKNSTENSS